MSWLDRIASPSTPRDEGRQVSRRRTARPALGSRIAARLLAPTVEHLVHDRLAAISARVDDAAGWESHTQPGPSDRPWSERADDLDDAFEAWRKNFLVRRIVTLARSYIIGNGITIGSRDPDVAAYIDRFWHHPENRIDQRLAPMVNELIRAGEVFATLHTNCIDGMSYVRFVPAAQIREIRTAPNDYELEIEYGERQTHSADLKWWTGIGHPLAFEPGRMGAEDAAKRSDGGADAAHLEPARGWRPLMLHLCINREIGCTRGEGDLGPLLPWAKRYTAWLQDRVRMNRVRTRQGIMDIQIADDAMVEQKRQQLSRHNPLEAGIYVHGAGEAIAMHSLSLDADDAAADGHALRLANATAANVGLHYLGEGDTINYATAKEMGEPTARYYAERQQNVVDALCELVSAAYRRYCALGFAPWPADGDLQIVPSITEVARADNESLARSAHLVVRALAEMAAHHWIDDATAAALAFKFAGEPLSEERIAAILANAAAQEQEQDHIAR
ncbi:MAG: hypothetical protein JXA09_03995 [Anaerolineae bacterium]|nr:hypothetical protein [Anaerolineae bacterium]